MRKSLVKVQFEHIGNTLTYYNDLFDLHCGDFVYVDGKCNGLRGRVVQVNYNFKIKASAYERVVAMADTSVHGQFYMAKKYFLTFDRNALPPQKVLSWFKAPEEYISSSDDTDFALDELEELDMSKMIASRGRDYYHANKVAYLCVDGKKGYAIVTGTEPYEVEFDYNHGRISKLVCTCPCDYFCKHEFATMLLLREMLGIIEQEYAEMHERESFFAAVNKDTLLSFAVKNKETGSIVL